MAEGQTQQTESEEFVLDFTPEMREKVTPNDGGTRPKVNPGDYRLRVDGMKRQTKTGEKPHVMALVEFKIVHAYDTKNALYVGASLPGLYAGSPQSPDFMQQRLEQWLRAVQYKGTPGKGVSSKELIGREFDACVVRELGKPESDPVTGATKRYTNDRVKSERPVGAPRPPHADPLAESREALVWEEKGGMAAEVTQEQGATTAAQTQGVAQSAPSFAQSAPAQAATPALAAQAAGPRWVDEATVKANTEIQNYRIYIACGHHQGPEIRKLLVAQNVNPDGPINLDVVPAESKAFYYKTFPQAAVPGLALAPIGGNAVTPQPAA
ncbi:MAG: hypothetical protein Q8S13_10615 [Dehalococcoidia bacterium]|nr:hypothetical protein [Dehalococcoidia bacterium]